MLTGLLVMLIVLSNASGDVLITRGMKEIGDISAVSPLQFLRVVKSILSNRNFLGGVFCLAVSFFSFLTVLSWADLSFVVPATAIFYVVSILGAKFILKEQVSPMRWAGTLLVGLGVALVCIP
jgi:bacterial/archaeal transporter family protein